jgi:hypothetical protein
MKVLLGMTMGAVGAAAIAAGIASSRDLHHLTGPIFGGMIGPLVATLATWVIVTKTFRANPAGVTNVMIAAFGVKAVFFGVYAVAMVKLFGFDVAAFGLSFAAFFIGLYAVEAALFARLFRAPAQETR